MSRVGGVAPDSAELEAPSPEQGIAPLTDELVGTLRDTTAERAFPQLAAAIDIPAVGYSAPVYTWEREDILRSNALTLLDLLTEIVPGLTPVRADWFGGPHQVLAGAFGPGFVSVSVDGRELTSLDAGQVDLTRVALANVERVRVRRLAEGWTADLTTLRRSSSRAYSRITGGTGDPGLSRLSLVFSNGAGRHFNIGASADLLNTGGGTDDFDFWGNVEWLPGGGATGIELHWESESLEREVYFPESLSRREVFLRARGELWSWLQAEGFAGTTELKQDGAETRDIDHAGLRLAGAGQTGWFRTELRVWDSSLFPALDVDLDLGVRPKAWLGLELGGGLARWDGFTASELRAGLALTGLPLQGEFTAQASTGVRGVAYPAAEVTDSVSFDAAAGTLAFAAGPYALSGRVEYQSLSRQLPFRAVFDRGLPAGPPVELVGFEGGIGGPIVPLNLIWPAVAPIRISGFWRHTAVRSEEEPVYLPRNMLRGEVYFDDDFFGGNLGVRLGLALNRRDPMLASAGPTPPPESLLVEIPGYTFLDFNLTIRVLEVRAYWRYENLTAQAGQDLPSLPFPASRNVFGVKWEFLN